MVRGDTNGIQVAENVTWVSTWAVVTMITDCDGAFGFRNKKETFSLSKPQRCIAGTRVQTHSFLTSTPSLGRFTAGTREYEANMRLGRPQNRYEHPCRDSNPRSSNQ